MKIQKEKRIKNEGTRCKIRIIKNERKGENCMKPLHIHKHDMVYDICSMIAVCISNLVFAFFPFVVPVVFIR